MNPADPNEQLDRVFGDRYRIEHVIGAGEVTAVFSAVDNETNTNVALKLFDEFLSEDERFLDRLMSAASDASTLDHPNIARILDWGVDPEPYIVSELCEGGSLHGLLEAGHRLSPSQALVMALECARALHHGHDAEQVHRNLKPQNILFSPDHRVRITDYGLAKVMADAPITQTSRVLENVRYASPEQARGRPVSDRSDLYSLALVVNEAVSGEQPRVAGTVVGTLMARAESPAELSGELAGLLAAIERCGRVDPSERPEAEELTIALLAAAETMPRPTAFPLVGLDHNVDKHLDHDLGDGLDGDGLDETAPGFDDATGSIDAVSHDLDGEHDAYAADPADDPDDPYGPASSGSPQVDHEILAELEDLTPAESLLFPDDSRADFDVPDRAGSPIRVVSIEPSEPAVLGDLASVEPVFAGDDDAEQLDVPDSRVAVVDPGLAYDELEDEADDQLPWWPLALLVALVAAAVVGGWFLYQAADSSSSASVPDLVGRSADDIEGLVSGKGWDVQRLELRSNEHEPGTVIDQDPTAGSGLASGEPLTVTVAIGSEMVEIPSDIVGLTVEQAESRLLSVGLELGGIAQTNSEALAAGLVIGLDEPTTQKPAGQGVSLLVSLGPEDRVVPQELIGSDVAEATGLLAGLRLGVVEEPVFDPQATIGTVLGSIPAPGEAIPADSPVTLLVSAGPEPVEIPDIEGLTLADARDLLTELGLINVDVEGTPGEDAIGTDPEAGEIVEFGSEVVIILGDPDDEADDG